MLTVCCYQVDYFSKLGPGFGTLAEVRVNNHQLKELTMVSMRYNPVGPGNDNWLDVPSGISVGQGRGYPLKQVFYGFYPLRSPSLASSWHHHHTVLTTKTDTENDHQRGLMFVSTRA